MKRTTNYFDLGATLYTPANHGNILSILQGGVIGARANIICLEDAVRDDQLSASLLQLKQALKQCQQNVAHKRFIRPRNSEVFAEILSYEGIDKIDGFVLPKFDLESAAEYRVLAERYQAYEHVYMPTLESSQVIDSRAVQGIKEQFRLWGSSIICVRIGGNDLMNVLGIKRTRGLTIYDTPLRTIIDQLVVQLRPDGYELSAPVFDIIDDTQTLQREIALDLAYGFYAKTAIHPRQVTIIESAFQQYSNQHLNQVEQLLNSESEAVFQLDGQMLETCCHRRWAERTQRFNAYYQRDPMVFDRIKASNE